MINVLLLLSNPSLEIWCLVVWAKPCLFVFFLAIAGDAVARYPGFISFDDIRYMLGSITKLQPYKDIKFFIVLELAISGPKT